jgi:hypothetical protein
MRHPALRLPAAAAAALLATAVPTAATATPTQPKTGAVESWTSDLGHGQRLNAEPAGGALRIHDTGWHPAAAGAGGYASEILPPHTLAAPADTVHASAIARIPRATTVTLDLRGRAGAGRWTAWQPAATAHFDTPVRQVQARVTLTTTTGQTPVVRRIRAEARSTGESARAPHAAVTARVFATREGLVGGTTANGHVITTDDHFVALPSGRGLSPKGSDDYSVRVCNPANGACLNQPVWDVGPWNTHDDYWSPSSSREQWRDLPQGRPEAQAAYDDGYHGGKDEFGRTVANPAGIDLADGTFADLGLKDNGYVDVSYLWTT